MINKKVNPCFWVQCGKNKGTYVEPDPDVEPSNVRGMKLLEVTQ